MADAVDSKSIGRKAVWVRLPPPAPVRKAMDVGVSGDASAGPTFVVMCLLLSSRWLAQTPLREGSQVTVVYDFSRSMGHFVEHECTWATLMRFLKWGLTRLARHRRRGSVGALDVSPVLS